MCYDSCHGVTTIMDTVGFIIFLASLFFGKLSSLGGQVINCEVRLVLYSKVTYIVSCPLLKIHQLYSGINFGHRLLKMPSEDVADLVNAREGIGGRTPLMEACWRGRKNAVIQLCDSSLKAGGSAM